MSVRHAPPTKAIATGPKRLDAVLRAGLERKVASLSLVSIDAPEERQGLATRKEQRSTPYGIRRRKQPLASNEELRTAVTLWSSDTAAATGTYGHISTRPPA